MDKQALYDEGVASVLLASLQSEAAAMRAKLDLQATQLAELEHRHGFTLYPLAAYCSQKCICDMA